MDSRPDDAGEETALDAKGVDGTCLRRLQRRTEELRLALAGRSLRVLIHDAGRDAVLRMMLTRDGNAVSVPAGRPFSPHVELRGTEAELHEFLVGEADLLDAVMARVVVLHIPEAEVSSYRDLRRLVADILRAPGD